MNKNFLVILSSLTLLLIIFTLFLGEPHESKVPYEIHTACASFDISGKFDATGNIALFEGKKLSVPEETLALKETCVLGVASQERWIEVDLSEQKLLAWEGDQLFLETPISSGLPWWKTPGGEFRVWIKLRVTKMEGGQGKYYIVKSSGQRRAGIFSA